VFQAVGAGGEEQQDYFQTAVHTQQDHKGAGLLTTHRISLSIFGRTLRQQIENNPRSIAQNRPTGIKHQQSSASTRTNARNLERN
jgi:hypothetical protein